MHAWNVTAGEAIAIQNSLREMLVFDLDAWTPRTVAGIDVTILPDRETLIALILVVDFDSMEEIEIRWKTFRTTFPYVPGLLSFREGPVVMAAFEELRCRADLLLLDGQGIAHPRGFGLASHIGLLTELPSIGCAKTRLVGDYEMPGEQAGDSTILMHRNDAVGRVVRTRTRVKPVFVSPGYRVTQDLAAQLTLLCCRGRRSPEPIRRAHIRVNEVRRDLMVRAMDEQ